MQKIRFKKSEYFSTKVNQIVPALKRKVQQTAPWVDVLHIGGTFIPGAYTKGEIDIQIRVSKSKFSETIGLFRQSFEVNHTELWSDSLAIFKDIDSFSSKVDILVTVVGSKDDNCYKFRDLLVKNKKLLEEYNNVKFSFEEGDVNEYKKAKGEFYKKLENMLASN